MNYVNIYIYDLDLTVNDILIMGIREITNADKLSHSPIDGRQIILDPIDTHIHIV